MGLISEKIERYTASISNFETSRPYVSISHCALSVDEILKIWVDGFEDTHMIRMRCYKGYQMEKDLKQRLIAMPDENFTECEEISAFNGLVLGHPDLKMYTPFEQLPTDCKSVPLDEHLPKDKLPRKVYWQMQGYMLYGNYKTGLVIYESRETGKIADYIVRPNTAIQREIDIKMQCVVREILRMKEAIKQTT